MPKISRDDIQDMIPAPRRDKIYSQKELFDFDEYLQKNKNRKYILASGEELIRYDWNQIYIDLGAKNKYGDIVAYDFEYGKNKAGEIYIQHATIPLVELERKIEQWKSWKDEQEFGERKKLEQLDRSQVGKLWKNNF